MKHSEQRAISGQVHRVVFTLPAPPRRDIEAHQCLAGSGHASNKHNRLLASSSCSLGNLLDCCGGDTEVRSPRVATRDVSNGVPRVEAPRRLDDRGAGAVLGTAPVCWIDRLSLCGRRGVPKRLRQSGWCRATGRPHVVSRASNPGMVAATGSSSDYDGEDACLVARAVEILEVEPVVPSLVVCTGGEGRLAALELNRDDGRTSHDHRIDPAADARHLELEKHGAGDCDERVLQNLNLFNPGVPLSRVHVAAGAGGKCTENRAGIGGEEAFDSVAVVGWRRTGLNVTHAGE